MSREPDTEEHRLMWRLAQIMHLYRGTMKIVIWVISKWPEFQTMANGDDSNISEQGRCEVLGKLR